MHIHPCRENDYRHEFACNTCRRVAGMDSDEDAALRSTRHLVGHGAWRMRHPGWVLTCPACMDAEARHADTRTTDDTCPQDGTTPCAGTCRDCAGESLLQDLAGNLIAADAAMGRGDTEAARALIAAGIAVLDRVLNGRDLPALAPLAT